MNDAAVTLADLRTVDLFDDLDDEELAAVGRRRDRRSGSSRAP